MGQHRCHIAAMRIHIDISPAETADPRLIASELLRHGAGSDDDLVTLYAGEPTALMTGRLVELAYGWPSA